MKSKKKKIIEINHWPAPCIIKMQNELEDIGTVNLSSKREQTSDECECVYVCVFVVVRFEKCVLFLKKAIFMAACVCVLVERV